MSEVRSGREVHQMQVEVTWDEEQSSIRITYYNVVCLFEK